MTFDITNIISYICFGFTIMITLEYTDTVYKNLVNPVLGKRKQHQTGFFSFIIAFNPNIKVIENVFFPLGRAATPQKEIFNKSTTYFMSLRAMTSRCQLGHDQKIDLVIKKNE